MGKHKSAGLLVSEMPVLLGDKEALYIIAVGQKVHSVPWEFHLVEVALGKCPSEEPCSCCTFQPSW